LILPTPTRREISPPTRRGSRLVGTPLPQRCSKQGREGRGEKGEEGSLPPLGKGKQKTAAILWYERRAQRCQVEQQSRATLRVARSLIGVSGISKTKNTRPLFAPVYRRLDSYPDRSRPATYHHRAVCRYVKPS